MDDKMDNKSDAVALTRIEGKLEGMDIRMAHMNESWQLANTRINSHSERLTVVENKFTTAQGEKNGAAAVVKVLWAILAVLLTGGLATISIIVAALQGAFH